ncbi:MAG TPA: ParB/RepB/Spo0J family partition protein [Bacteroidota bacterium]|nr:ParB/RepB/Spo0J family partition protein [Bacteroidota bacterium]
MTNQKKSVLGRGLSALIPKTPVSIRQGEVGEDSGGVNVIASVELERIRPNPFQPRTDFDSESLEELSKSILEKGLIQPITVRRLGEDYQLVSGERRMRAAQRAGLPSIPAFIIDVQSDSEMLELALVENIQREELNPIEIAHAYRRLIDECRLTQDEVGQKVGKDRSTVTNFLRLLKLPEKVREGLRRGRLTMGHARALLGLDNERDQLRLYDEIVMGGVNVRSVERTTRARKAKPAKHTRHGTGIHSVEEQLKRMLGTKVKVYAKSGGKGEIVIQYFSADDLERILELILDKRHR